MTCSLIVSCDFARAAGTLLHTNLLTSDEDERVQKCIYQIIQPAVPDLLFFSTQHTNKDYGTFGRQGMWTFSQMP